MDKEVVVHIHNGILAIKKNAFESVLKRWMNLEPIIQLSAQAPLPNKVSCFVSTCVSLDSSFLSVRQEPSFRPRKRSSFLQRMDKKTRIAEKHLKELLLKGLR